MNTLLDLCQTNLYKTDKFYPVNGWHSYIENFYSNQFLEKKLEPLKILEIGIYQGFSLCLWKDYFINSDIFGIDLSLSKLDLNLDLSERITLMKGDAYSSGILDLFKDEYFDIVIDDGPHTFESQKLFFEKYFSKVKKNGYLICEDIKDMDILLELTQVIPTQSRKNIKIIDLREIDNRTDSLMLFLKK